MQTKNINIEQAPMIRNDDVPQKMLFRQVEGETKEDFVPPVPPRTAFIFTAISTSNCAQNPQVEVEGYGPYKPVPPPKPLPQQHQQQQQQDRFTPPPYRMPPYPLYNEPNIPGAATIGLEIPSYTNPHSQGLHTHSNKFPIEREVILSSADKNSKIPILHEYKKRAKVAIAPDVPPKQMAAWTQMGQQSQILSPDQTHPGPQQNNIQNGADQGIYRSPYQEYYSPGTGAVPRSLWQQERPSPAPRQFQSEVDNPVPPSVTVQIEPKDNSQKESGKKSVTKTYQSIKDLISNRFKGGKDAPEEKVEEAGLNNMEEVRNMEEYDYKKTAGEQGIYGKPRTDPTLLQYNQHLMQQHILASQTRQIYQLQMKNQGGQNFFPAQLSQARSQEILATQEQLYYQSAYGSGPQKPSQRYPTTQAEMINEKRSAQQLERDNLRQRSFEARRTASQPQLAGDEEAKGAEENRPQPQSGQALRRGSHGNIIEAIRTCTSKSDAEKDSDDGGFLKRGKQEENGDSVFGNSKLSEALVGTPRKKLEGEIGKIEGVYNVAQKRNEPEGASKPSAGSGASSDYDKHGPSSSNADSGRGSAAYSSGRRPGGVGVHSANEANEPLRNGNNYKDLYNTGQDSEWVDVVENELRTILEPKLHELSLQGNTVGISNSTLSESISSMTPPLPPLSPGDQSSPNLTPRNSAKYKKHNSLPYGSKPDYGHDSYNKLSKVHLGNIGPGVGAGRWNGSVQKHRGTKKSDHSLLRAKQAFGCDTTDMTSTTTRSLDLDSMLDNQSDSEGDISTTDARTIRKQLESLEGMYSEVLKLLGVKRHMGRYQPSDPRFSKRRYGSMSSLPSSSVSSRPIRDKRRAHEDRKKVKDIRGVNKRFQRLESHVVTLARSVAHLSSEMRTQHLMIQEMENIRAEMAAMKTQTAMLNVRSHSASRAANSRDLPSLANPTRVKKLTKFFGDEPPLLRLFLRKLGYEKYASIFENERIGMVELPYISEERLQKMGVPLGPRLRILQEAQISVCRDTTLCIV